MPEKKKYHCEECNYGFRHNGSMPVRCPYCGQTATVQEQAAFGTDRLVKDI
ncbi:hypothetical protein HZB01_00805 [Candidatus Woesearchaeota archaeon]|nr:hypothetical protein [Candidatus Woesearchaeota archaeon]